MNNDSPTKFKETEDKLYSFLVGNYIGYIYLTALLLPYLNEKGRI